MNAFDDFDLKGKRILIRIDINTSIIKNKIQENLRFKEHAKTLKEISKKRARIVILAHQGKKGSKEYRDNLKQHSKILSKLTKRKIIYVDDLFGEKAIKAIKNLGEGEMILLKNTRSWIGETKKISPKKHSQGLFVKKLKNYFDLFIQDSLSVCHRNHASIVGFPYVLPSCQGRVLQKELEAIDKINNEIKKPLVLLLGGKKIKDYLGLIEKYNKEKKLQYILTTGIFSLIACISKGINLGIENKLLKPQLNIISKIKPLKNKLILPIDFAIDINGKRKEIDIDEFPSEYKVLDIGEKTIKEYRKIIKNSKTVFVKGTAGNYEKKGFEKGTKILLKEVGKSKTFSLVGGGDTISAVEKYKIKGLNHISLSGGALLEYLAGKKLPGLEILNKNLSKNV